MGSAALGAGHLGLVRMAASTLGPTPTRSQPWQARSWAWSSLTSLQLRLRATGTSTTKMRAIATGRGNSVPTTRYPDLIAWSPPRSALDLVGLTGQGKLALAGHDPVTATGPAARAASRVLRRSTSGWSCPPASTSTCGSGMNPQPLSSDLLTTARVTGFMDSGKPAPPANPTPQGQERLLMDAAPTRVEVDETLRRARSGRYTAQAVGRGPAAAHRR